LDALKILGVDSVEVSQIEETVPSCIDIEGRRAIVAPVRIKMLQRPVKIYLGEVKGN